MKYKIMTILILWIFIGQACSVNHATTQDKLRKKGLASSKSQETTDSTLQRLESFISNTSYCALIKHTSVDVVPIPDPDPNDDDVEEKHINHANVLETYRGQHLENISYTIVCEKGEETTIIEEPVVVTLCIGKDGLFYWPGTGSLFPATKEVIKAAQQISQKIRFGKQSFPYCD